GGRGRPQDVLPEGHEQCSVVRAGLGRGAEVRLAGRRRERGDGESGYDERGEHRKEDRPAWHRGSVGEHGKASLRPDRRGPAGPGVAVLLIAGERVGRATRPNGGGGTWLLLAGPVRSVRPRGWARLEREGIGGR